MKTNPCKWCGREPEPSSVENGGWFCGNMKCRTDNDVAVDFDTWQKNNPLPNQFKVGDWVNTPSGKGKVGCVQGEKCFVNGKLFGLWFNLDELAPATRLKRKEIRKVLKRLLEETVDGGDIDIVEDGLNKLIEEI